MDRKSGYYQPEVVLVLAETWAYCLQQTQGHPDASLLLWRGVEMVILSTLSMDIDTLRAALLFPLADANVVSEDVLRERR